MSTSHDDDNQGGLIDCHGSSKALRLLKSLTKTPAGNVLYQQVERILRDADHTQDKIIRGYTALVLSMIEAYRRKLPRDSLLYLELKLIQKRLIPPISISELATLHSYIKNASRLINELSDVDDDVIRDALAPLLGKSQTEDALTGLLDETENTNNWAEQQLDSGYRQKLDQQQREFNELQQQLSNRLNEASSQLNDFKSSLSFVYNELGSSASSQDLAENIQHARKIIQQLIEKQENLPGALNQTRELAQELNTYSDKLRQELDQARVLSLTDDLTHLPNRRAFYRRLEDEISRSQRESTPLILGLVDLDFFKEINDRFGHGVGDEILKIYATEILSTFRHYDMVARYGGEEFAIILPNTDHEGAMRAFSKVKNKAADHFLRHEDTSIVLPTFSAGLARHQPGEPSKDFIERVDALLYRAKQTGRNRIETDQNTSAITELRSETYPD